MRIDLYLKRRDTGAYRVAGQSCHVVNSELLHDPGPVRLDRLDRQVELAGDLLARVPLGDQPQHLAFTATEAVMRGDPRGGVGPPQILVSHLHRDRPMEIGPAPSD